MGVEIFLQELLQEFKALGNALQDLVIEEGRMEKDILVKSGFLIKKYSLNYSRVNLRDLDAILNKLERIKEREIYLQEQLAKNTTSLNQISKEYEQVTRKELHTDLIHPELKEVVYDSILLITRIKQLKEMLRSGLVLHKKSLGKDTSLFFASFENLTNRIIRFIHLLEQLTAKIVSFEKETYYPEPRVYGRVMSSSEFKKTVEAKCLVSGKDPTPVFDAPSSVRNGIRSMSPDQLKNFFSQIGVASGTRVVFFQTKVKPFNFDKPIPQSNGLREYKFPRGMSIEILATA